MMGTLPLSSFPPSYGRDILSLPPFKRTAFNFGSALFSPPACLPLSRAYLFCPPVSLFPLKKESFRLFPYCFSVISVMVYSSSKAIGINFPSTLFFLFFLLLVGLLFLNSSPPSIVWFLFPCVLVSIDRRNYPPQEYFSQIRASRLPFLPAPFFPFPQRIPPI